MFLLMWGRSSMKACMCPETTWSQSVARHRTCWRRVETGPCSCACGERSCLPRLLRPHPPHPPPLRYATPPTGYSCTTRTHTSTLNPTLSHTVRKEARRSVPSMLTRRPDIGIFRTSASCRNIWPPKQFRTHIFRFLCSTKVSCKWRFLKITVLPIHQIWRGFSLRTVYLFIDFSFKFRFSFMLLLVRVLRHSLNSFLEYLCLCSYSQVPDDIRNPSSIRVNHLSHFLFMF